MNTKSTVRYDASKNRIYLTLEGSHDLAEARRMRDEYRKALLQAKPGFTVLADVSNYKPGTPEVQTIHSEAVHSAEVAGVTKVARYVGETPLGGMQINRIAKRDTSYASANFSSIEEAEDYLDK